MIGNKQRILLIHRFFYPDSPPYATILEDMRKLLTGMNYIVDVLSTQPSYKQLDKKKKNEKFVSHINKTSKVFRLVIFRLKHERLNKLLNFFWFPLQVFCFLFWGRKYQVITVSTSPPVILAFLVAVAAKVRGSQLIYHCMDIHPEIGRISGEFKGHFIFKLLTEMDNFTCKTASKIIVLSKDMKASLVERSSLFSDKIEIINNYDLSSGAIVVTPFFTNEPNKKRIVFTGNIGRFQGLEAFIQALKQNEPLENFELIFVGEGTALSDLKALALGMDNVIKFIPHQSVSVARKIISEVDMGIVSLQEGVINYANPSKTMTYLAEGTPVLVVVDSGSELSGLIKAKKIGVSLIGTDLNGIYELFKNISMGKVVFDREYIKSVFENNFSKKQFDEKISRLLMGLTKEK